MPDSFSVTGGQPLHGTITIAGAKNAASKILLATMLSDEPSVIDNVPLLGETDIAAELIEALGGNVERDGHRWTVSTPTMSTSVVPELSRKNRLPILALGVLLHRTGQAEIPFLGGDAIGPRPVDYHLDGLQSMGAEIETTPHSFRARTQRLVGTEITLPYPSVGATETVLMAAVLAQGRTTLHNAAIEPEVIDLIHMLQSMGATIHAGAHRVVTIDGVERLHGTTYHVIPDRIEAASLACIALATNGDIIVEHARSEDLSSFLQVIQTMGAQYDILANGIRFRRNGELRAIAVETDTHPGYMTDWQQPLVTVMTQSTGISTVHETVYEDRFGYIKTLQRMGANITTSTDCFGTLTCRWRGKGCVHSCRVEGPTSLQATTIAVPDIRAGMAHLIAALIAEGTSTLTGIEHLDRGYQDLATRLQALGANIIRHT